MNVLTGDFNYERETNGGVVKFNLEGGDSNYVYTDNVIEIDSGYDPANLGIVVMIVNQNNTAINSQFSRINSFQDFN